MNNANEMLVLAEMMGKRALISLNTNINADTVIVNTGLVCHGEVFNPTTDELLEWLSGRGSFYALDNMMAGFNHIHETSFQVSSNEFGVIENILDIAIQVSQYIKMNVVEDE